MSYRHRAITMPCSTCGFVASAVTVQAVSEAYFAHREAAHQATVPPPMLTALQVLAQRRES